MLYSFCIEHSLGSGVEEGHHNLGKVGGGPGYGSFWRTVQSKCSARILHNAHFNVFQLIELNMFPGELMFVLFS